VPHCSDRMRALLPRNTSFAQGPHEYSYLTTGSWPMSAALEPDCVFPERREAARLRAALREEGWGAASTGLKREYQTGGRNLRK
jgi:hypothetical protein